MKEETIERVAVIGAGVMGLGIGLEFARFGYQVSLYNTREATSEAAMETAREDLDLMVETQLLTAEEARNTFLRLQPTNALEDAASSADYIIECAPEELALKQDLMVRLEQICSSSAILATNTSSLLVSDIAAKATYPNRIIATHYYYPAHFIPLVEVTAGQKTDTAVTERVVRVLKGLRKRVVLIAVEIPDFIGNRLQGAIRKESQSLIDKGICTPQMIDDVIIYGFGRRTPYSGYFKRLDLIGLDGTYLRQVARGLTPWPPVAERVKRGELGMKSGKGFYDWPDGEGKRFLRKQNSELIRLMKMDMEEGAI